MKSINSGLSKLPIRLTDERWAHIIEEHPELENKQSEILYTIEKPERIYQGNDGELLAVNEIEPGKFIVVVYKETDADGYIITAFYTRRLRSLQGENKYGNVRLS